MSQYAPLSDSTETDLNQLIEDDDYSEQMVQVRRSSIIPQGTFASSVINISNTILGSGMVAMPSAVAAVGLINGIILILLCGFGSAFGLFLLAIMASEVGRKSSFFSCSQITYPFMSQYFDFAIAIKCFGVSISYLVITGGLIPQIVSTFYPKLESDSIYLSKEFWITVSMIVVAPTCFLRRLDSLKYTSGFSLVAVLYLVFVVVLYFYAPDQIMLPFPESKDLVWFKFDSNMIQKLPIFVFAFTCHQNIFAVHNELEDNRPSRINKVIGTSIFASTCVYLTIGIIGYLTFGNNVSSNIITQYPSGALVTGAQIAIAFLVLFSFPLQLHPCRASLDKIIPGTNPAGIPAGRFIVMTLLIMFFAYLFAVTVSDLTVVLGLVGATGSTTICYILPGIFYYKLAENQKTEEDKGTTKLQKASIAMVVIGICIMVVALYNIVFARTFGH